jgi:class 3 adenylate cyclase/Tfp pilus assembly protein PilF
LEHFEDASPSLLDFLIWLIQEETVFPLKIIGLFNHNSELLPQGMNEHWEVFFNYMEDNGLILHKSILLTANILDSVGEDNNVQSQQNYLYILELQKSFFAYDDPKKNIGENQDDIVKARTHLERGQIYLLGGNYLQALIELQEAVSIGRNRGLDDLWRGLLILALAYYRNKNQNLAEKTFYSSAKVFPWSSKQLKEDYFLLFQVFIFEKQWDAETNQGIYRRLVALEPKTKEMYLSVLQGRFSYFHNIHRIFELENAIALAKLLFKRQMEQGNEFRAARLLHFLGYFYQSIDPEIALGYYSYCIEIRQKLKVNESLVRVYNGTGYYCSQIGRFDQAIRYYRQALELLEMGEDFVEISLTIFNIAQVYFLAGNFKQSLHLYQKLLAVMDAKGIDYITYHPIYQIHSYCGLSAMYLGRTTTAVDYYELAEKYYDAKEIRPIFPLFEALISPFVGKSIDQRKKLQEASDLCQELSAFQLYVQVRIEESRLLREAKEYDASQKVLETLMLKKYLQPGTFQYNLVQHFYYGGDWKDITPVELAELPIEHLAGNVLAQARRSGAYDRIFRKIDQMGFLKNFQNQLQNQSTVDGVLEMCIAILGREFKFTQLILVEKNNEGLYSNIQLKEISILPAEWQEDYFQKDTNKLPRRVLEEENLIKAQLPFFEDGKVARALFFASELGSEGIDHNDLSAIEMALKDLNLNLRYIMERDRSETLLRNVLPGPIAVRLMSNPDQLIADRFPEVSILFADLVNFTRYASQAPAVEMIHNLNELFSLYDDLVAGSGLEKIKTIGDSYMVAGGIPDGLAHRARDMSYLALDMLRLTHSFAEGAGVPWDIRIGLHAGPVVAGVIGKQKFNYDVWGDTVNFASRLETHGLQGRIHVSKEFKAMVSEDFSFESRGEIAIKGMDSVETFFLVSKE